MNMILCTSICFRSSDSQSAMKVILRKSPRSHETGPETNRSSHVIGYECDPRTGRLPPAQRILIVENLSPNLPSKAVRKNYDYDENGDIKVHGRAVFNYRNLEIYGVALSMTLSQTM